MENQTTHRGACPTGAHPDATTKAVMTGETWRTVRHALAIAFARHDITAPEYFAAMTEVMGTADRNRW